MNGNIVKVDNLKNSKGKRRGFMIVQAEILNKYRQERRLYEFMLYNTLLGLAGTDFNLTVASVRKLMGGSRSKAQQALKRLEADGLIKARFEKDGKGDKTITTQDGRKVPNTRRIYEIYTALPATQERTAILLTPGAFIAPAEFTADEIQESESAQEQSGEVIGEMPQESQAKPPQLVQTPPPVLKPPQTPVQRNSKMAIEQRKEKVYRIADSVQLFSKAGKEKLLYWLQKFAKEVGRPADDEEIAFTANLLSGDSNYNLNGYIKRKALAEKMA